MYSRAQHGYCRGSKWRSTMNKVGSLLLATALCAAVAGCKPEKEDDRSLPVTAKASLPMRSTSPPGWPQGDALQAVLKPDEGATRLIKSLYRDGDTVLEQTWPDSTREYWWYSHDGQARYIARDGKETVAEHGKSR